MLTSKNKIRALVHSPIVLKGAIRVHRTRCTRNNMRWQQAQTTPLNSLHSLNTCKVGHHKLLHQEPESNLKVKSNVSRRLMPVRERTSKHQIPLGKKIREFPSAMKIWSIRTSYKAYSKMRPTLLKILSTNFRTFLPQIVCWAPEIIEMQRVSK